LQGGDEYIKCQYAVYQAILITYHLSLVAHYKIKSPSRTSLEKT